MASSALNNRIINLHTGGGEFLQCTPLEAADYYEKNYPLPDLTKESFVFRKKKETALIHTPEAVDWNEVMNSMQDDPREKNIAKGQIGHIKGDSAEKYVLNYISRLSSQSRIAVFPNYDAKCYLTFKGEKRANLQEFDFFVIFGDYKKIVQIEVKAHPVHVIDVDKVEKLKKQLEKGKTFVQNLFEDLGIEKEWSYIPMGALPNIEKLSQVKKEESPLQSLSSVFTNKSFSSV